jgi:hypothetical protein
MSESRFKPEDFETGEVVGAFGPDPNARIWVVVDIGPPESDQLIDLAAREGTRSVDLALELIREGLAARLAGHSGRHRAGS